MLQITYTASDLLHKRWRVTQSDPCHSLRLLLVVKALNSMWDVAKQWQ